MNHDSAGMNPSLDEPRAPSPRPAGAGAGIGSRPVPGSGASGAGVSFDPLRLDDAMRRLGSRLAADPSPLAEAWIDLARSWGELWTYGVARMAGAEAEPVVRPDDDDRRFRDPAWDDVRGSTS